MDQAEPWSERFHILLSLLCLFFRTYINNYLLLSLIPLHIQTNQLSSFLCILACSILYPRSRTLVKELLHSLSSTSTKSKRCKTSNASKGFLCIMLNFDCICIVHCMKSFYVSDVLHCFHFPSQRSKFGSSNPFSRIIYHGDLWMQYTRNHQRCRRKRRFCKASVRCLRKRFNDRSVWARDRVHASWCVCWILTTRRN